MGGNIQLASHRLGKAGGKSSGGSGASVKKFFQDAPESKGFGWTGDLLGNSADVMGLASAFTDGKTSDGLGLGAGLASTASSGMGLWGAITGLMSGDEKRKEGKGWDLADSIFGLGGGISDTISASAGLAGDEKTKKRAQIASGVFGLLGAGSNLIHGIQQLRKGEKAKGAMSLINSAQKAFGGITNIGQGASDSEGWQTAGKVSASTGVLVGLMNTIANRVDS